MIQILLAEDNPADVVLVRLALQGQSLEHQLHVVKDGAEAIDFFAHISRSDEAPCPDIMLLDINLPKVQGPEVLAEFRRIPECVRTPVIVVSSSDSERDRVRMAELGITSYFRKPSDLDDFMQLGAVVRKTLEAAAA